MVWALVLQWSPCVCVCGVCVCVWWWWGSASPQGIHYATLNRQPPYFKSAAVHSHSSLVCRALAALVAAAMVLKPLNTTVVVKPVPTVSSAIVLSRITLAPLPAHGKGAAALQQQSGAFVAGS